MELSRDDQFVGLEFDWFALDSHGLIAICSSAGWGEIPSAVLQTSTPDDTPDHYVEQLVTELPAIGGYRTEGRGPGSCNEWKLLGQRGLFVYDWRHWQGPYDRIIVPEVTVTALTIPTELLDRLRIVTLDWMSFADCSSFDGSRV